MARAGGAAVANAAAGRVARRYHAGAAGVPLRRAPQHLVPHRGAPEQAVSSFSTASVVVPVTDPSAFPIMGVQATLANGIGIFTGGGGTGTLAGPRAVETRDRAARVLEQRAGQPHRESDPDRDEQCERCDAETEQEGISGCRGSLIDSCE
ncbi:MAG: hypothetical protein QNK03_25480 [Myxococcota bacterium]|nr:hypothetical protein [Myxococcota bacterium]